MKNTSGRFIIWLAFIFFILTICSIYFTHLFDIVPEPHLVYVHNHSRSTSLHLAGLILARGGSKGIPHKNVAKIGNVTLISKALGTMIQFGKFDSIWVSTDDKMIAEEAKKNSNVLIHWREAYTATDSASSVVAVREFLDKHPEITVVGLIQCTSPFLKVQYLEEAYRLIKEGYNSVFSTTRQHNLRWAYNSSGQLEPDNFDLYNRPRRQDWSGEIIENGMFYFTEAHLVKDLMVLQGGKVGFVEVPYNESLQIDNVTDLEIAEVILTVDHSS